VIAVGYAHAMHAHLSTRFISATAAVSIIVHIAAATRAAAQAPASAPVQPPRLQASAPNETPWPVVLGTRTAALERDWPIVDQVVLVPDGRTYLDEIAKWSPAGRWPVLIEDGWYAPMFVRAFAPARVLRRESAGAMPADRDEREKLIATSAAEAISDGGVDILGAASTRGITPSMLVIADANDPAWTAAVALAAGRCAPIHFTSEPYGKPDDAIDAAHFKALESELERAADRTGLAWKGLGDAIDAFVICRDFGWKCVPELAPGLKIEIPNGPFPTAPGQPVATLNTLGRHADGMWWAIGAGIFGSEQRSAYVAMCSLFAPRRTAWMTNAYDSGGGWGAYDIAPAASKFEKQGFATRSWSKEQNSLESWRRVLMGGFDCDVLVANSHGMPSQFGLFGGGMATVGDVPIFDRPVAVHFLHSFSLEFPANPATVGGAFLEHGAYAYFGSVYEPLLPAFVPPELLAERSGFLVPFAVSARVYEGGFARPWRTAAFGDPLVILATPERLGVRRVPPPADGVADLRVRAAEELKRFRDDSDTLALAKAMRDLELVGSDEKTVQLWSLAQKLDTAPYSAPFVLGALFRARDLVGFVAAYELCKAPPPRTRDMLWQLATPRLSSIADAHVVALLGRDPRGPDASVDLALLKPAAVRVLGRDGWSRIVADAEAAASDDAVRGRVSALR
jgi:hypothetical protein